MSSAVVVSLDECGYGDAVVMAWIAEGWKRAGVGPMLFKRGNRDSVVHLLSQELTDLPSTVRVASTPDSLFQAELTIRGRVRPPRTLLWQEWLPHKADPVRPPVTISDEHRACAAGMFADNDRPMVVLFPWAAFGQRCWPIHKWVRTAWALQARGFKVVACDPDQKKVCDFPHFVFGHPIGVIAALCQRAVAVAGNDSGGTHIAGTLGVPTVAVMGPTTPSTVYGYCPDITPVRVERDLCDCVGCHFEPEKGFGIECNTGCEALSMLGWEAVEQAIAQAAERRLACCS